MSTKTTIKRIALVAVSALGLGVLTTVSASAATTDVTSIIAGTSSPARIGVSSGQTTFTLTTTAANTVETMTAQIVSAPSTSAAAILTFSAPTSGTYAAAAVTNTSNQKTDQTAANGVAYAYVTASASSDKKTTLNLKLNADVAGTYQVLVAAAADDTHDGYAAGDKSALITITTAGAPTTITTSVTGAVVGNDTTYGAIISVSLKDAAGAATVLGLNESLLVTHSGTTSTLSASSLGSGSTNSAGVYAITDVANTTIAAGSDVITIKGDGVLPSTLVVTQSVSTVAAAAVPAGSTLALVKGTTTANGVTKAGYAGTNGSITTASKTAHSYKFTPGTQAAADTNYPVRVTTTAGVTYATYVAVAGTGTTGNSGYGTVAVSGAVALADASHLIVDMPGGIVTAQNLSYAAAAVTNGAVTVASPGTGVMTATAGSTSFTVYVTDQYGLALANQSVTVQVAGRNTVTSGTVAGVSDASGYVTYTLTDKGTVGTTDSVTFTSGGVNSSAFTVTYGTFTVGSISFTGGSTDADVTSSTPTINAIEGDDTPESAVVDAVATVKDANGSIINGVPVTFTISGTGAAITTTTVTAYTVAGKATAKVYAWLAGTYTVTATAGGKSATGSYTFANKSASYARTLTSSVAGNIVTATVKDRFGNPVAGVTVYATTAGGVTVNGKTKDNTVTTDTNGNADFVIAGSGDVTVSTIDYSTVGAKGSGQTCARAGAVNCNDAAADDTLFTATTAGTSLVDAKNVGSTYAPAGVASSTISVNSSTSSDSVDAANEATDAANAATDAANAAAEAADAATAAAQDAQAAVAALATQVASLIAGIKAQITTLTNLVIKIQKKVRA